MRINDLKSFLVADLAKTNKYVIYDVMPRLDPELGVTLQMITFSVLKYYQGPTLKEGYKPSRADFLSDIENILAEIKLSADRIKSTGPMKNGNMV